MGGADWCAWDQPDWVIRWISSNAGAGGMSTNTSSGAHTTICVVFMLCLSQPASLPRVLPSFLDALVFYAFDQRACACVYCFCAVCTLVCFAVLPRDDAVLITCLQAAALTRLHAILRHLLWYVQPPRFAGMLCHACSGVAQSHAS